jgi:hypothetical protein
MIAKSLQKMNPTKHYNKEAMSSYDMMRAEIASVLIRMASDICGIVASYAVDPRLDQLYAVMAPHHGCRMTMFPKNQPSRMSYLEIIHCHPNMCFKQCRSGLDMERYRSDEPDAYCRDSVDVYHWQINVSYYPMPAMISRYSTHDLIELLASRQLHTHFEPYHDAVDTIKRFEEMFAQFDAPATHLEELRYPDKKVELRKRTFAAL